LARTRTRAILDALAKVTRRDRKSIFSFSANNISYTAVALLFMSDPGALIVFAVIIAMVLFFPLTADPLRKIPPERLSLWPLAAREHRFLRVMSVGFNPLVWLLVALLVWKRVTLGLWALVAVMFAIGFAAPWRYLHGRGGAARWLPGVSWLPRFPTHLNQLLRKNLRELLATLDFYAALVLALAAAAFRVAGRLPSDAFLPLTLLVMLLISTCALSLFGLDGEGGFTRYQLLPLPGWQILAAKDAIFLLVCVLLTAPLHPLAGFAAALMALAAGRGSSIGRHGDERRWRFRTSHSFGVSVTQIALMIAAGAATAGWDAFAVVPCLLVYGISVWRPGHLLERHIAESVG
jgi:hypothetical protein